MNLVTLSSTRELSRNLASANSLLFRSTRVAGASWDQWRARGHDQTSLVADPKFVDPDAFNLTLQSNSPAIKLGFKPIDLSRVGPRFNHPTTTKR